jgi:RHS repeat-associated protein
MLSVSNEGTPNLPTTIMSYSYDNVGNVRSMTDTINGNLGIETTREYDALNRLTVNAQGNKRVDYTYNAISQVTNKKRYSDITGTNLVAETNHIYDQSDRLTNIIHSNGANTISSYAQTYDAASKITSVTGTDGSSTYTYDDTNQLTGADYDFQADESYSYDGNGNRTNDGYVTGVNNQLLEDNKYLYEYDLVGNRTKRTDKSTNEVMEYRWDIRDRLTGITVKNDLGEIIRTAEYTYDVYNQRIAKTVDTDGDGSLAAVTERFVYGNDQNIALVFDENGNVNHRYLFGNGIDQIEADESNGNVLWALTDHLGSVRDVVDDSGTVLNHVVYDAFGGVTSQTDESVVFRYGYTARELDAESGLQYNRARYLDSFTGKFISEDPIGFGGGDSNLYRYVFNSPLNGTDPSGLQTASDEFPIFRIPPILDLGQTLQDIGNGISEVGKAVERFLVPPAEAPNFPSNPQASKKRNPSPTPSPSNTPNPKLTPIPLPAPFRHSEPYYPFCPTDDDKGINIMTVQFQNDKIPGRDGTLQDRVFNTPTRGVRVGQVVNKFLELRSINQTSGFPFPRDHKIAVDKGVTTMIDFVYRVQAGGGAMGRGDTIQTFQWDKDDKKGVNASTGVSRKRIRNTGDFRIEIENNKGYNLRDL